jgi:peptidyl-prolyl cis-trans isomerase A (cyclophilin A)
MLNRGRRLRHHSLIAAICVISAVSVISVTAQPAPVVVVVETSLGAITIEVNVAKAPITAANFLKYVDAGLYNGGRFHRTVRPDTETRKDVPIAVVQATRAPRTPETPSFPPIELERTKTTGLKHVDGAVSMARATGANTGVADFFICIGAQPALDFGGVRNADGQGFAVFGRVIAGMDVVKRIHAAPVRDGTQTIAFPIVILKAARKR